MCEPLIASVLTLLFFFVRYVPATADEKTLLTAVNQFRLVCTMICYPLPNGFQTFIACLEFRCALARYQSTVHLQKLLITRTVHPFEKIKKQKQLIFRDVLAKAVSNHKIFFGFRPVFLNQGVRLPRGVSRNFQGA